MVSDVGVVGALSRTVAEWAMSEQVRGVVMNDAARDGELDLGAVGRALVRKKWWVLGPAIAVAALTFVGVNLLTPRYKSEARIIIEGRENVFFRTDAEKGTMERDRTIDPEAVTSQVQLALSRDLARQVIKQLKLGELPEFDSTLRGVSLIRYSLGVLGLAKDPLGMTPEERVLEAYYERLTAFPVDKSRVIAIEFQSADPELAARIANTIADTYLSMQQNARQGQTRAAGQWLAGQIEVMRKLVAEAEGKVEEFRGKTNLFIGSNNTMLSNQTLGESNRDLAAARSQKAELESKARVIRDLLKRGGGLEASNLFDSERLRRLTEQRAAARALLSEQSSTLLDNHPRIKELKAQIAGFDRQIRDEAVSVATSLETDAKIAGARVEQLSSGLDQLKVLAASTNGQDVELRALEREAKAQRDLLESYLAKYREASARDSVGAVPADARIISSAFASNTPFFPKKLPIVLIATLATLFVTAGFITTGELLAGNVYRAEGAPEGAPAPVARVAEPVMAAAPGPFAAAPLPEEPLEPAPRRRWMPSLSAKSRAADVTAADETTAHETAAAPAATPVDLDEPAAAAPQAGDELTIEAMAQALREAGDIGKRIAVVGAARNIATTPIAVALARALARDARVILIDFALERPDLATISTDPRAPGLAELARGTASFAQVITRDRFSRVQMIAAGRVGPDAASVVMSERLTVGIDALSRTYDHVVIDAGAAMPPERVARLAPCGVLVASGLAATEADAGRTRLGEAGFTDVAVFAGTAPALDAESAHGVAA
jgi:succinoglycan biosynthesis transport protein ExoP